MRCRDVEALCTAYVDGELDQARASAVRGHLRTCASCRTRVEDEAALRDAAADLEPIDPPAALWAGIEGRLAEAEIADADHSRLWFWWQGLRQRALPVAVVAAAAIALAIWSSRRGGEPARERAALEGAPAESGAASAQVQEPGAQPRLAFLEQRRREVLGADDAYASAIADLRAIATEERSRWPAEIAAEFDAKLAELDAQVRAHARGLALNQSHDPQTRDALYAAYRAQLGFLQRAVLGEL